MYQNFIHWTSNISVIFNKCKSLNSGSMCALYLLFVMIRQCFHTPFVFLGNVFGAICLQETWLTANADLSLPQMPVYKLIHQGHICSKHGGLLIYLNDAFTYDKRTLYKHSDIWEGLFIDVSGPSLNRPLTIGNIYRPPHDNNNNENISTFIAELSPIIDL